MTVQAMDFSFSDATDTIYGPKPVVKLSFRIPLSDVKIDGAEVSSLRANVYLKEPIAFTKTIADDVAWLAALHYRYHLGVNSQRDSLIPLEASRNFQKHLATTIGENFLMFQNMGYIH